MTAGALAGAAPARRRASARRFGRAPLAVKLAIAFLGLVALVLIVNGAIDTYLTYNQAKRAALEVESEKARGATERVGAFLSDIQTELGWTAGVEWGYARLEQQRYDFIRLLRQAPAITALSYIDARGKEQIAVSRLEPDAIASGKDFSADPRFVRAVADRIWFGPVEFRRGSEPYMTIALAHVGKAPGVTVADVNLKLVWDVVSAIRVGDRGFAYVVDDRGRLIAHPDLSLVLRDSDFSKLPQVAEAMKGQGGGAAAVAKSLDGGAVLTAFAIEPKTHWAVFVEQPLSEALAAAYATLARAGGLLGLGLLLAAVTGVALARALAAPIRVLQAGAERLGAGDLTQRLDIRTGDEIEALASGFNRMAGQLQESYETLEAKVEARTKDLNEALAQRTATAEVLKVISRSAFGLKTVLQTLVDSAVRLCASDGVIYLRDGDVFRAEAAFGAEIAGADSRKRSPRRPGRDSITGRVALSGRVEQIPDNEADPEFQVAPAQRMNMRALLGVPLLRDGEVEGVFVLAKPDPGLFNDRAVELVRTFADQAVIAIQNVRLFDAVQAKTRDLEESLAQQTATADVLKVISRSVFDLQTVFETLLTTAVKLVGGVGGAVSIREGERLRFRAGADAHGYLGTDFVGRLIEIDGSSAAGRTVATGLTQYIPDADADPEFRVVASGAWGKSYLGVPLTRDGKAEGALTLIAGRSHAFTPRHIELVQTFADQAVIAIENARLFEEVQARTRDLEESLERQTATSRILEVIASSPTDATPVFSAIADSAKSVMRGFSTTVWQLVGDVAHLVAYTKTGLEAEAALKAISPMTISGDIKDKLVGNGESVAVEDTEAAGADPDMREVARRRGWRSSLNTPLQGRGSVLGFISVTRTAPGPFSQQEIEQLRSFANQAVIAIENARLFNETQEALERQKASAEILRVISASPTDVRPVFDAIALTAGRLFDCQMSAVFRVEGASLALTTTAMRGRLLTKEEFPPSVSIDPQENFPSQALIEKRTLYVKDFSAPGITKHERTVSKQFGFSSALYMPLICVGECIGVFLLTAARTQAFTDKDIALAEFFRDQAQIALENTRLFNETQEALQQQTATADVLKVISRSAFDLDAIFQTLVMTAVDLCKAPLGTLCVRDGEVFRYRGMAGPEATQELQHYLEAHPLSAPDRRTIAGRAILSRRTEEIEDVLADDDYAVPLAAHGSPTRSVIGVPLIGKTQVLGAIVLARAEPGAFPPRHVEVLKTFADQAVIAIENSRLFDEVQARTRELETSLADLRRTQDRLVQSEKLASLGQLTAGIAHEIKNPLNFVNNFASLSRELLEELRETLQGLPSGARADADDLMGMIDSNLEKVASHGKRADSIVKNMLLHSREGSGERTSVDVNAMVEEAINLGYHGARAEKPGFNVTIEKSLDPNAGEAELYLQEVTRVLLNLISNGFYAADKRRQGAGPGYEPTLRATTRDLGHSVEIRIRDNGTGIPEEVRAKMFNPFFTTKPAGEGTGLGLSLSHDIVVKQHGGTLDVETAPGAFTEFVIALPRKGVGA